jgi:alkylation response protein AidB-like acyl-CoA dehydrogenase
MEEIRMKMMGAEFLLSQAEANDIFTPEDLTDEHHMIAATTAQFVERDVKPYHDDIENQDFDRVVKLLRKAGELGLLGHSIPEAYGGLGLDKVSKGLVGEIIGGSGGYGVAHSNHTCIATLPITYFGTPEQKAKYLPKMASGEYIGAYCLTEPSSGSDALGAKTTAYLNPEGSHYILNGTKQFITNAQFSDTFIVYAKVDGGKFTAFIVEKDYPGLSLGPEEQKMGIKGSSTRTVILEDCLVPVENLLGEVGRGHTIAFNVLNLGRFNLGSACMGGSKHALERAIKYTKERRQFGKALTFFTATQEKIANMACRIYAAESLQYRTAGLLEDALGDLYEEKNQQVINKRMMEYAVECAVCKVYGSETLDQVVDESLQLHGGYGFIKEYRMEQMYRDSRINRIFEGTNEINRLIIPGFLFRKAASDELQLQAAIEQAITELQTGKTGGQIVEEGGILTRERAVVQSIRRIFLALAGLAYETFGKEMDMEQETLMKLSEIGIHLYATESVVLRTLKAIERKGIAQEGLKEKLTVAFIDDSLLEVETTARQLLGGMSLGEKMDEYVNLVKQELGRYQVVETVFRKREIAKQLIKAEQYKC